MRKLVIIILSLLAIASLLILMSRQPQPVAQDLNPVDIITDSLVTPAQPLVLVDSHLDIKLIK